MNQYNDYFTKHYKYKLSSDDIKTLTKWFYTQWKFFSPYINLSKSTRILEIGSGIGVVYSFLKDTIKDTNYVGLELDPKAVSFSNTLFKTKSFKNVSIEKFNTKEKFDTVFAFEVLEHVDDPVNVIAKISSLLSNDGVFIGTSPYPFAKNVYADETHKYVLHPTNWKKLFKENGFSKIETYPMSFFPFLWRLSTILNVRIPFYVPFPYFISTTLIIAKK